MSCVYQTSYFSGIVRCRLSGVATPRVAPLYSLTRSLSIRRFIPRHNSMKDLLFRSNAYLHIGFVRNT